MPYLLTWPKRRRLTSSGGVEGVAVIEPGRLVIWLDEDRAVIYDDPEELRAFAMQVHAAAVERDLSVQEAAVKASIARRAARGGRGNRFRPVIERPEPPAHMEEVVA